MYNLDINFLKERPEYQKNSNTSFTTFSAVKVYDKKPLYAGVAAGVLAMLGVGGYWFWLDQRYAQLEIQSAQLDKQLGGLQQQEAQLNQLKGEISQIQGENKSLATIFQQFQPWLAMSAILQDIRENIPQGVQINTIEQSKNTAPKVATPSPKPIARALTPPDPNAKPGSKPAANNNPEPVAAPIESVRLDVSGYAKSFDDVNNFLLTLKRSSFFDPTNTQLVSAELKEQTYEISQSEKNSSSPSSPEIEIKPPKLVEYKIQTSLKAATTESLIRDLESKGAVGLVTRLRSLEQQQLFDPEPQK
jgi:type IV pilus assembly protein PilN